MQSRMMVACLLVGLLGIPLVAQESSEPTPVEQLIEQLGDPSYRVRQDAERALRARGADAAAALEEAAKHHEDSEVRWRARRLLQRNEGGKTGSLRESEDPGGAFEDLFQRLERDFDIEMPKHRFFADGLFTDLRAQMDRLRSGRLGRGGGIGRSDSLQMKVTPDGVSVKVTEKDENGETHTKTYEAPDLETLRSRYPELAERITVPRMGFPRFQHWLGGPLASRLPAPDWRRREPQDGPVLGVHVRPMSDDLRGFLDLEVGVGILVESVADGSLAQRLGVQEHDVVVEIEGQPVGSAADVRAALRRAEDTVSVVVNRHGERLELEADWRPPKPEVLRPRPERRAVIR